MRSQAQDPRAAVFRAIAALIDTIEATDSEVRNVTLTDRQVTAAESFDVEFEVTVSELTQVARMGLRPEGKGLRVDGDGTCSLAFTVKIPLEEMVRTVAPSERSRAETEEISGLPEQVEESGPIANGGVNPTDAAGPATGVEISSAESGDESTTRDGPTGNPDESEKPYRDPDRLKEVYEEFETFAEMRDALGVDVTPQTVRRHMIKHDIHEVSTNPFLDSLQKSANDPTELPLGVHTKPRD